MKGVVIDFSPKQIRWLKSFIFTLVIEAPVFILFARSFLSKAAKVDQEDQKTGEMIPVHQKITIFQAAFAGAIGTCLTHPLLWFVWPGVIRELFGGQVEYKYLYSIYVISGELIVATIESFTFYFALSKKIPLSRAVAASFFANASSFGLGQLLRHLFPGII